jgi:GntR family transcriptional repressor for pyruvate dehydrogenase complex
MFEPVKPSRISEDIASQIKAKVLAAELKPDDKLPSENELAGIFGASRAMVREALRSLEGSGFIEIRRGSRGGSFVSRNGVERAGRTLTDALLVEGTPIAQVTEARLLVEPALARLAAERASAEDLEAIGEALVRMEASLASGKTPVLGNLEFHRRVAHASHNAVLVVLLDASLGILRDEVAKLAIERDLVAGMLSAHQEIYEALRCHDVEAAHRLMTEHVEHAHDDLSKACLL